MDWTESLGKVLGYIEDNLDGDLSPETLARRAAFSRFYLQRVFAVVTDMTLSEYVRGRRLTAAALDLRRGEKVIDVALRYSYDTPESFQKAFRRFHGITPSAAKRPDAPLKCLNPLKLTVNLLGGSIMDYKMESIPALRMIGREYAVKQDAAYTVIPALWDEYYKSGDAGKCPGYVGLCMDTCQGADFTYMIGHFADDGETTPEGFTAREIPAQTWVKFLSVGAMPKALQKVNRRAYTEWLPNNPDFTLASDINLEVYTEGDMSAPDYECELWLPVKAK